MANMQNWHKFVALGVILIIITSASYFVISDLDPDTSSAKTSTEQQQHQPQKDLENQIQNSVNPSLPNLPIEVGEVASSTALSSNSINKGSLNGLKQAEAANALEETRVPKLSTESTSHTNNSSELPTTQPNANDSIHLDAQASQDPAENEAWQKFKMAYNKSYLNSDEEHKRRVIFNENRKFIKSHNEKGEALFTLGINQFGDLTRDEVNQLYFGAPAPSMAPPPAFILKEQSASPGAQVDWRNLTGGPVDQGMCRDSAIFAAIASMEAAFNKKFSPNVNIKLSEQQLIDCMTIRWNGQQACQGNFSMVRLLELLQQSFTSLTSAENYQRLVDITGHKCEIPPDALPQEQTKLAAYMSIHRDNILEALYISGPLCITIDASHSTFHFYQSGLYHDLECSTDTYNHHAVIVGHSSSTNGDSSKPYYLLRNSFGKNWGESGYMRLLKDELRNRCLPQSLAISPNIDR